MAARKHHNLRTEDQLGLDRFTILSVSFNQDQSCFSVGTENGFLVYNTDPMECRVQRDLQDGGIGFVQMLYRTNYLALVGGGRTPKFPQNKVVIWDDLKHQAALSIDFLSPALRVILSRTHIVVCLRSKIHIYTFASPPAPLAVYETADNPLGVCGLSNNILVFPARTEGQIQIVDLSPQGQERNLISIIKAHKSAIKCLTVSMDGSLVASASDTGTIIRIHVSTTTALLHEFRRGLDRAFIYSLSFSPSSGRLALLSDKGTLHVYSVSAISSNRRHILGKFPLMPRYFSSEWSFVSARVAEEPGVVGWSGEDSVIVIWTQSARWEKYVIVEREYDNAQRRSPSLSPPGSHTPIDPDTSDGQHTTSKWELVREGWRNIAEAC